MYCYTAFNEVLLLHCNIYKMNQHEQKEELEEAKSFDFLYYLIGLVTGVFTGAILDVGMICGHWLVVY